MLKVLGPNLSTTPLPQNSPQTMVINECLKYFSIHRSSKVTLQWIELYPLKKKFSSPNLLPVDMTLFENKLVKMWSYWNRMVLKSVWLVSLNGEAIPGHTQGQCHETTEPEFGCCVCKSMQFSNANATEKVWRKQTLLALGVQISIQNFKRSNFHCHKPLSCVLLYSGSLNFCHLYKMTKSK